MTEGWRERLAREKQELDERTERLEAFLADSEKMAAISPLGQGALLRLQLPIMQAYSRVLGLRLKDEQE